MKIIEKQLCSTCREPLTVKDVIFPSGFFHETVMCVKCKEKRDDKKKRGSEMVVT